MSDLWVPSPPCGSSTSAFLPLSGGTMTGPLILAADPVQTLEAATKQYVDARQNLLPIGDNRIINGDMRIDQRNNGASGTANQYTVDRWIFFNVAGKGAWGQNLNSQAGPALAAGFPYCLGFNSSSAYTAATAEMFVFAQQLEGDAVSDFAWGAASAQPVTLSFWALSSLTGTFSGSIQNYAATRSYPFTFSLPTATNWIKIVLTIPGDTAGAWVMSSNAGSLVVSFDLGSGASRRGPAGAWASANYYGATGAVSVVATNAATFYVTGVKLEIGSIATPFNRQSLAKSMADCQRYYTTFAGNLYAYTANNGFSGGAVSTVYLPVTMRAAPTIAPPNVSSSGCTGKMVAVKSECSHIEQPISGDLGSLQTIFQTSAVGERATFADYPCLECGALTMTYTLTAQPNIIVRDEDQSFIPTDPDNMDYQEFLAWCDDGNEPAPYTPPAKAKK